MKLPVRPALPRTPVNLQLLRLFVQVAEMASISAAARESGMSPSLAARKIAALERTLDARLFERTTRSIKLTEPGQIALRWASQTLDAYEEVQDGVASLLKQPSGTIRLAVNHYAAQVHLAGALSRFCLDYPEIRLSITTTDSMVRLVEDGYDLAIHSGSIPASGVVGLRVHEFRRVICASPAYLARRGTPEHPNELVSHDCLVHADKEPTNWFFRRGRRIIAQPIRPYIEADTNMLLVELARRDLGIVRMGYDVVSDDLAAGTLVEVITDYKSVYSTGEVPGLWLIYPNRRVLYRTRLLIDFLSRELLQKG